uniref:DNA mismatch repair proteins mutS family domain-containing protein n=1 Tax=viral metagenome TaxID=1070528 RepID=A0A6C0D836_9ZZZZ
MALIKEYFELTKHYTEEFGEKTILLMQVGAFFEVYGLQNPSTKEITCSRIEAFASICDLHIADKKICVGKENVVMAGFSTYMIEKYVKKLESEGFTTPIHTQDENAKNTNRTLSVICSPGTYFNESSKQITNNIMCIWLHVANKFKSKEKEIHIGVATVDICTGNNTIFQLSELYIVDSPTTFDELDRINSIHNPSEVILIGNITEKEMNNAISYSNIQSNSIHKISTLNIESKSSSEKVKRAINCEKQIYQKTVIEKFFPNSDFDIFSQNFYQNTIATQAYCFVLDFIYQHNPNLVNKLNEPVFDSCSDRLILANHSLKQLNIIDDGNYNGKFSSVEKLLNLCVTSMGKRSFSHNLLNPTTKQDYLKTEYDITEHILNTYTRTNLYSNIKIRIGMIKDIEKIVRQIIMKKISPQTIWQFHNNLLIIKELYSELKTDNVLYEYFKLRLNKKDDICSKILDNCDNIIKFLEIHLLLDLCKDIDSTQQFETNFIKSQVDVELDDKTNKLFNSTNKLEAIRLYLNETIFSYEKKSTKKSNEHIKLHETEKNNLSIVATKRRCNILKEIFNKPNYLNPDEKQNGVLLSYSSYENLDIPNIFRLKLFENIFFSPQTSANDTIHNPTITELCSTISSIKVQMKDLITKVYLKILNEIEFFQSQINQIVDVVTLIDVIFTKANIAHIYNYCKPEIVCDNDKSFVNAKGLRHCLIEHIQQNELYVSNDVELGDNITDGILLYGTNAVGKTSLIRALGITVIMAQAGLFVPCSSFQLSPYKYIFTRILGNDNMFKNMSTFAVEMYELRTILRLANNNSLVLGDELCSGTESISATSIFVAGIQHLYNKKSSFIFATHLHEIVNYDEISSLDTVKLKHMAVVYDKQRELLVYDRKIKDGSGDNMYGLEVCKSLNLPSEFIELANDIRMKYHKESGSILSLKTSHFNSKKIVGICEKCGERLGTEVHHLNHQKNADQNGYIQSDLATFHKNHSANLMTLCENCHHEIHKEKTIHKKVKTSKGTIINNYIFEK